MEELKQIVDMLVHAPQMVVVAFGGWLLYKLIAIGSIVGSITLVAQLFINRFFDFQGRPRTAVLRELDVWILDFEEVEMRALCRRLRNRGADATGSAPMFLSIKRLRRAVELLEAEEAKK